MQTVFERIKDRLPITDVLSTYITLQSAGTQFKAKCPFHNEKTASFSVSPDRGLYYCFGCGAKGDIFTFVEQFEGLDRKGALRVLADRAGVVLDNVPTNREATDPLYDVLEEVTVRYQNELLRNEAALAYLTSRGITMDTIKSFRIGFAPNEWRFVALSMKDEATSSIAERAGLIKKTEKGYYDRFRNRIMFPLMDASGRVVGFSGRILPGPELDPRAPKYLNSPETEVFQKSRILFAFDKAKFAIKQHGFAIAVEGQMDVVLSHQAGLRNTVATSGTAVSDMSAQDPTANLSVLARLTPNILFAFDGDAAGQKALDRAAMVALSLGMNPKVVPLPEGVDPADLIMKEGKDRWIALLKESRHFILHQLKLITGKKLSPHMVVSVLRERIFPFLVRIPSPIEQKLHLDTIATELGIPTTDIAKELALFGSTAQPPQATPATTELILEEESMSLLERFVVLTNRFPSKATEEAMTAVKALIVDDRSINIPKLPESRLNTLLLIIEREYGSIRNDERDAIVIELGKKLCDQFLDTLRLEYTRALVEAESAADDLTISTLLTKLQAINQRRHMP